MFFKNWFLKFIDYHLNLPLGSIYFELCRYLLVCYHIRTYSFADWREDIKKMMLKAGIEGLQTVFLFSDQQIREESYVEDINMILNTADIPNLFPADEKADLIEKMQVTLTVSVHPTLMLSG